MTRASARPAAPALDATDRWCAGAVAAASALLYLATLCPTVYVGDSGELAAVADCAGIAHPPGYPLFTLLYAAVVHTLPFGEVAWRTNVLTALLAAVAVAVVYRTARRLGTGRAAATAAACGLAVTRPYWSQAVAVEVYAMDALLLALAFAATAALLRDAGTPARWLRLGLAFGLCVGHRPVNAPYVLLLALWLLWRHQPASANAGGWLRAGLAAVATGLVFAYLPIAASLDPPMNMGDPDSWNRFWQVVRAAPYQRHFASSSLALTLGRLAGTATALPSWLGATLLAAAVGAAARRQAVLLVVIAADLVFASVYNIIDNDGFFQPALIALALLAAQGYEAVLHRWPGRTTAGAVMLLAIAPMTWTWSRTDLRQVFEVDRYARDMMESAEPDSLVLVFGDTQRATLAYLQVVYQKRPDLAVLSPAMLVPWHVEAARRRGPSFPLPALPAATAPQSWLRELIRHQLVEREKPVYLSSRDAANPQRLLPPDLGRRADLVPAGVLYRLVLVPADRQQADRLRQRVLDDADAFWRGRPIPQPTCRRPDPQLTILPVHYAEARFELAVAHLWAGHRDQAEDHLAAIASTDVDRRERQVAAAYRAIGRTLRPHLFAVRAAAGLAALRAGDSPQQVMAALARR